MAVSRHVGTLEIDLMLPQSEFHPLVHGYFTACELRGQHLPMGVPGGSDPASHTVMAGSI